MYRSPESGNNAAISLPPFSEHFAGSVALPAGLKHGGLPQLFVSIPRVWQSFVGRSSEVPPISSVTEVCGRSHVSP